MHQRFQCHQHQRCRLKKFRKSNKIHQAVNKSKLTCAVLNYSGETNTASCVRDDVDVYESQKLGALLGGGESTPARSNSKFASKVVRNVDGTGQINDLNELVERDWRWQADDGDIVSEVVGCVVLVESQSAEFNGSALLIWLLTIHEMSADNGLKATDDVDLDEDTKSE